MTQMTGGVTYYAIVGRGRTPDDPSGLARRRHLGEGYIDESLRRDLSWRHTTAVAEWQRGEELGRDLIEISQEEADRLVERFRERWARSG